MNSKPILFSGEMVNAIIEGRKTQTRRVIKQIRDLAFRGDEKPSNTWAGRTVESICPYGQPGDLLWVRENWRIVGWEPENGDWLIQYGADGKKKRFDSVREVTEEQTQNWLIQCEDDCVKNEVPTDVDGNYLYAPTRWRPSIHMPRWASRITLKVVNVRVEQLRKISEEDARAEGVMPVHTTNDGDLYVVGFSSLWNRINYARGFGWDVNPWVWVIEFKRVTPS